MKQEFLRIFRPSGWRPASLKRAVAWTLDNPPRMLFLGLIRLYQVVISPAIPSRCKYYPSCSQYALDAVREYGAVRGFILASWRVLRCNPLSYGGYDPVSRQTLFRSHVHERLSDGVGHGSCDCACDGVGHSRPVRG